MVKFALSFVMVLMVSAISFSQFDGFQQLKKDFFFNSVSTKSEAVRLYGRVMDRHGSDTTRTPYTLDNNPLVFSSLILSKNKVLVGFIVKEEDLSYSVLFYYIKNEDTYFFDVKDISGVTYQMRYEPIK